MIGVLGCGIVSWLAVSAYRAQDDLEVHTHTWFEFRTNLAFSPDPEPMYEITPTPTPFASRFWRKLSGRPRPDRQNCGLVIGQIAEVCALGHPEILRKIHEYPWAPATTPAQQAAWEQLRRDSRRREEVRLGIHRE